MHEFFAGLRHMLAFVELEQMNLGVMAHQMIKEEYIPRLQNRLKRARTDEEREKISQLISDFELYSNERNSESWIYSKTAAGIVRTLSLRARIDDTMMEDLTQQLAIDFLQPLRAKGVDLRETMKKFGEMQGPIALNKFWMRIVDLRTRFHIREFQRANRERTFEQQETEEGEERDPVSQIPSPSMMDEGYVRQVMKDLVSYMHRKLTKPEMVLMFDRWWKMVLEKGLGENGVDIRHDVIQYLRSKNVVNSPAATMTYWWLDIKKWIVKFFDDELGGAVSYEIRRMLRVSSTEVLTYEAFRHRLAAWMLGGIIRGMVERS